MIAQREETDFEHSAYPENRRPEGRRYKNDHCPTARVSVLKEGTKSRSLAALGMTDLERMKERSHRPK
jgi:hypothetical protein